MAAILSPLVRNDRSPTGSPSDRTLALRAALTPPACPACSVDKRRYSPFVEPIFLKTLDRLKADTLVISGSEIDVCVLMPVMDAVDVGCRVVLADDAPCSVPDESRDAMLRHFGLASAST